MKEKTKTGGCKSRCWCI